VCEQLSATNAISRFVQEGPAATGDKTVRSAGIVNNFFARETKFIRFPYNEARATSVTR
jgi:hypothetical protein